MNPSLFIDEPLIVPPTPGEVLVRLSQLAGAPDGDSPQLQALQTAKRTLMDAFASGDHAAVGSTLAAAQQQLFALYEQVKDDEARCAALGFPTARFTGNAMIVAPVDVETVTATFTLIGKQILTSLSFERAANATSYWLHEVRHFEENPHERVEDAVIEKSAPLFDRLRLPSGPRVLRIKSRNLSVWALSEEFTIQVPFLTAS